MFSSITLAGFLRAALVTQADTVQYSGGHHRGHWSESSTALHGCKSEL